MQRGGKNKSFDGSTVYHSQSVSRVNVFATGVQNLAVSNALTGRDLHVGDNVRIAAFFSTRIDGCRGIAVGGAFHNFRILI